MFIKKKLSILTFLTLIFSLTITFFPINSAYAAEEDRILDIYGDPIVQGQKYILVDKGLWVTGIPFNQRIAPVGQNRLGVTYEIFSGYHYPIQYKNSSYYGAEKHKDVNGNVYYGTPFMFEVTDGGDIREEDGMVFITNNTSVNMLMNIEGRHKYINAGNRGWIYFSDQSRSALTVKKINAKEIQLITGRTDFIKDKFGMPSDWYFADSKQSTYGVETTFQLYPSGQLFSNNDKLWGMSIPIDHAGFELVPIL
ncbi:hypothetical protein [Bacillus mycoides]|uniref:hypothetical protein n=1 Tax=Bacillus mycoides TaxID=1405 RepID=UPI0011A5609B|nr:hypothetical protein [Bacillus mycoides]